jgi:L-rhamnonate dehydratase
VNVAIPITPPRSKSRRPNWNTHAPRALPINKYAEFPTTHSKMPGANTFEDTWVQVIAEDGSWGLGQTSFGEITAAVVDHHFAPLLVGRDCMALEYLNDLMWRSTQRFGAGGLASVAQSGIDLALWDLKGKLLDQPVYRLLGGPSRERVLCYATSDDLDWSMELGFKHFKVSNPAHYDSGIDGLNMVEEKIASARETVGPDAELMYNPVMSFNVEFAVVPSDLEGHVELRKRIPWMPIATGEDHHGRWTFRQLIEHRAVDVLQPDIKWCGGLSEAIKIYILGEAAGLITVPHTGAGTPWGQHFSMAMPESPMAEFWMGSDPGVPLDEVRPIPGMPMPKDGYVTASDAPGFGMEIAEEWITPWVH